MFKTVHHFLVIYIFLKDQSLDYYNKFSVSGGSTSDTPWYLEEGKKKKKDAGCHLAQVLSAMKNSIHTAAKHISHKVRKHLGACQLDANTDF